MYQEKRLFRREAQDKTVQVTILPDAETVSPDSVSFECRSRDLSREGIRLHGQEGLPKDSLVHLKVDFNDEDAHFDLTGRVIWTTETTEREHVTGLLLTKGPKSDLRAWQQRFPR